MDSCELRVTTGGFLGGREALKVSGLAEKFASDIFLEFGGLRASARSVAAIMVLGVIPGDSVVIRASGPDAAEAARALSGLIAAGIAAGTARSPRAGSGVGG
jgi:phosphotransferase system HPr (HPr) family protein